MEAKSPRSLLRGSPKLSLKEKKKDAEGHDRHRHQADELVKMMAVKVINIFDLDKV